ncbi:3-oxoacyl-ACP reductase FabG [Brachybacterium saurashtrense]|uniref:SDR family NAD(P)-dependent oxidoreductase n=1 Tax=Brachybacterium saurashtrense TaxID=556288 RepID=A0A345YMG4_9MICO|nr:3-oxoacyl-ACP reductase FabG [Brachybacterium saurashtrense]AXK45116.1 SDR family NAD(P)-dependent oxidoreductase [Brachybacterium saurashtrense]RRR22131.1 SDR family NAD(P)-dependent oxidoreductase [Brachybacterium saurashtrense]
MTDAITEPRSVLITGGNRGIGRSIAEEFLRRGDKVAVTSRSGEGGPEGALTVAADVTDGESLDAAIRAAEEAHGPIQVLVANAGITDDQLLLRMGDDSFETVLDTNLTGAFRTVKRVIKSMIRAKKGRIVLISSVVGLYGSPGQVNYAASKSGLVGMARALTRELGSRGITANVVAPGYIDTEMTQSLPEDLQASYRKAIPAGRFAAPSEVAKTVAFLAGDDAAYISGAVIPVDGGLGMGH